ncbi:MAG: DUF4870 domain-containing protein [Phycisphaerales bacterium]|nr:MAG: DUF4870 domain-containing protein [Phycisphaerales bacterium]
MTETDERTGDTPSAGSDAQAQWVTGEITKEARMWAMFCHLAGLVGLSPILPGVGSAVAPFVIWQLKADEFPFVAEQGRRAVNFQLSMLLYGAVGAVICLITLVAVPLIPVVFFVVGLVDLIFVLIAAVHVNAGEHYRYPLTIRFFKQAPAV